LSVSFVRFQPLHPPEPELPQNHHLNGLVFEDNGRHIVTADMAPLAWRRPSVDS
jgi:hypothetical protein